MPFYPETQLLSYLSRNFTWETFFLAFVVLEGKIRWMFGGVGYGGTAGGGSIVVIKMGMMKYVIIIMLC